MVTVLWIFVWGKKLISAKRNDKRVYEFQEYLKFINVRIGPGDQITTSMRYGYYLPTLLLKIRVKFVL